MFRMCSSQIPPLRSSLMLIQKRQLHSENLHWPTPQRMVTWQLSTPLIFRAPDMFKRKPITSDGYRCHTLTMRKSSTPRQHGSGNNEPLAEMYAIYGLILIGKLTVSENPLDS